MPSDYLKVRADVRTAAPSDPLMSKAVRWTVFTLKYIPEKPKPSKIPVGRSNDPSTWNYFAACRVLLRDPKIAGLGFQMFGKPGLIGIDIDRCINGPNSYTPMASQLLAQLEAAGGKFHVEITPGGNGLRVFAADTPLPFHDYVNQQDGVEVYQGETSRFLTFTGAVLPGFGEGPFSVLPPATVELLTKYATRMKGGANVPGSEDDQQSTGTALPDLPRRSDWTDLHPGAVKKLGKEGREFITDGVLGKKYSSASEQLFAVETALIRFLKPEQAYQVLISAEGSWNVALEHRENNERRAKEFIWSDLQRAEQSRQRREGDRQAKETSWKDCDIVVGITEEGAKARVLQINQINALSKHPDMLNRLGFNTFDGRVTLDREDVDARGVAELSAWLTQFLRWEYEPARPMFEESLFEAAKLRPWNPIADELRGAVWDGKSRFEEFARALTGADSPLDCELLRKWLISYVARGLTPGAQVDTVLCLREPEGGGFKTSFARVMAGSLDRYSESHGFKADKESAMLRVGMRVIELAEGVAAKKSDRHELKADVTKLEDHFRPLWGKQAVKRPRGFVYVLTVNEIAFLRADQDGLRRIWPVDVAALIDLDWIKANRDQVLAEAVRCYDAGERWWYSKGEEPVELKSRQYGAVAEDFLDGPINTVLNDPDNLARGFTSLTEIKTHVEALAGLALNAGQSQHLIDILHKHGFFSERRRASGSQVRVWTHPAWRAIENDDQKTNVVILGQTKGVVRDTRDGGETEGGVSDILE